MRDMIVVEGPASPLIYLAPGTCCPNRRGEIVETGDAATVTSHPRHAYTRTLLLASPVADVAEQRRRREAAAGTGGRRA